MGRHELNPATPAAALPAVTEPAAPVGPTEDGDADLDLTEPDDHVAPVAPPTDPAPATQPGGSATGRQPQPVLIASAVQAVLAAAVTLGWLNLDSATIATCGTVLAGVIALAAAFVARGKVTPTSSPRTDDGRVMVSAHGRPA